MIDVIIAVGLFALGVYVGDWLQRRLPDRGRFTKEQIDRAEFTPDQTWNAVMARRKRKPEIRN